MIVQKVEFPLQKKKRVYPVWVGQQILGKIPNFFKAEPKLHVVLLADQSLPKYTQELISILKRASFRVDLIEIPGNEKSKDFDYALTIFTKLLEFKADRSSVIFALGGGVIGDLAGFVAATYLRGIRWVGVPTTLLAQVDSSLGGKTAVNHPLGKNLIGAFHQPVLVVCDTAFLKGISERDRVSGFGEIVKYALTFDAKLWKELKVRYLDIIALEPEALSRAIAQSLEWKAHIFTQDEREEKGIRELLNFGHSVAHALEGACEYGYFRHGEAVIWGMRVEAALSVLRGHLSGKAFVELDELLASLSIPKIPTDLTLAQVMGFIRRDKKNRDGNLRFVLLKAIGKPIVDSEATEALIAKAFKQVGVSLK